MRVFSCFAAVIFVMVVFMYARNLELEKMYQDRIKWLEEMVDTTCYKEMDERRRASLETIMAATACEKKCIKEKKR